MSERLLRICQESLFSGEYSTYDVANKMEKKYPTLMKEFNPYDLKAKLGAATLFSFMKVTKNIAPLQYMAHELGYALIPLELVMQTVEPSSEPIHAGVAKNQHSDYC